MEIFQVDNESNFASSKMSLPREKSLMVRPLSRKDIFYSGSVVNLKEYQSQKSLTNYRQSVISIPNRPSKTEVVDGVDVEKGERKSNRKYFSILALMSRFLAEYDLCPCFVLPDSFKTALAQMMDVSLLKDPVFMMIGISNFFGMAGLYVPFVYLVDCAVSEVSQPFS